MSRDESKPRRALWVALVIFLLHGLWLSSSLPVWHEEVSVHAQRPYAWADVAPDASPPMPVIAEGCADPNAPLLLRSPVRPVASLCVGGLAWPLLVSSYASGVTYWPLQLLRPLHHGEPVPLRWASLLIGVLSLLVMHRLVERHRDRVAANTTVLVAALLSPFVHLHALLVVYEHVPTLLVLIAVLVLDPPGGRPPDRRRLLLAGALAGLALASNIKALVVGVPLLGLALWRSPRMRAPGRVGWASFVVGFALVAGPFVALALSDPYAGVSGQVSQRGAALLANLDPRHLLAEVDNALIFFTDFGFYLDVAAGEPAPLPLVYRVLPLLALGHGSLALVRLLRGGEVDRVAAGCGAVLWTFIVFVALFYRQTPAANYGPIVHVHAIALGVMLVDLGRWLAVRFERPKLEPTIIVLGPLVLASALWRHGDRRDHMPASIDVHALQQLADWQREHDDARVVVTTYNLVGVLDAMAASRTPTLTANQLLRSCPQEQAGCRVDRLAALFRSTSAPLHVVVPLRTVPIDERGASELPREVCEAAHAAGRRCDELVRISTRRGVEVLGVLSIVP